MIRELVRDCSIGPEAAAILASLYWISQAMSLTIAPFPEAPVAWMLPLHAFGTALTVLSGNIGVFATGRLGTHLGMPTWLARAFMTLGAFGFVMFFVVQAFFVLDSPILPPNIGTLERLAVYPLPFVQFVVGTALLVAAARVRRLNLALRFQLRVFSGTVLVCFPARGDRPAAPDLL